MNRLKLTYALNVKFKSVVRTISKSYEYTGVPVSVRVPLPPFRDSLSVPFHLSVLIHTFLSTDKWVDLEIINEYSTIHTSTVTRTPLTWFTICTASLSLLIHSSLLKKLCLQLSNGSFSPDGQSSWRQPLLVGEDESFREFLLIGISERNIFLN